MHTALEVLSQAAAAPAGRAVVVLGLLAAGVELARMLRAGQREQWRWLQQAHSSAGEATRPVTVRIELSRHGAYRIHLANTCPQALLGLTIAVGSQEAPFAGLHQVEELPARTLVELKGRLPTPPTPDALIQVGVTVDGFHFPHLFRAG